MSDDLARVNLLVIGKVQGVFFRSSTLEQAQGLNLTGWVKNCADGAVEILAEGPRYALEQLLEWSKHGPPAAVVEQVSARWGAYTSEFRTFMIIR